MFFKRNDFWWTNIIYSLYNIDTGKIDSVIIKDFENSTKCKHFLLYEKTMQIYHADGDVLLKTDLIIPNQDSRF